MFNKEAWKHVTRDNLQFWLHCWKFDAKEKPFMICLCTSNVCNISLIMSPITLLIKVIPYPIILLWLQERLCLTECRKQGCDGQSLVTICCYDLL